MDLLQIHIEPHIEMINLQKCQMLLCINGIKIKHIKETVQKL